MMSRSANGWRSAAVGTLLLTGCYADRVVEDVGTLCIYSGAQEFVDSDPLVDSENPPAQEFLVNGELYISMTHVTGGSTCKRDLDSECYVTREDTAMEIHGLVEYESRVGLVACSDDIVMLNTTCRTSGLMEGTYTISFGDQTTTLEIPSSGTAICMSN